jgi:predicted phosphodiesterase
MLNELLGMKAAFVWGNCDYDRAGLERYAKALGVACYGAFGDFTLDGKRMALIHGDDHRLRQQLLAGQEYDYLFQGHTHVPDDRRVGRTRVINPGALHRANPKTAALLDTAADRLESLTVGSSAR